MRTRKNSVSGHFSRSEECSPHLNGTKQKKRWFQIFTGIVGFLHKPNWLTLIFYLFILCFTYRIMFKLFLMIIQFSVMICLKSSQFKNSQLRQTVTSPHRVKQVSKGILSLIRSWYDILLSTIPKSTVFHQSRGYINSINYHQIRSS